MKRDTTALIVGSMLILAGFLFLLTNFGLLRGFSELAIALLFLAGGVVFLLVFLGNRDHWWAAFPAFALFGIGALIALTTLFPGIPDSWGGTLFLACLSLGFWLVYATHPENWWAVIPGGVLLTLAGVAGVANFGEGKVGGGLFFLGLALTFALVYVLPTNQGRMTWAVWPAAACLAMSVLVIFAVSNLAGFFWPVALIAVGLFMVYRNVLSKRS